LALTPLTEADIIELIYSDYENDNETWDATSAEYYTARNFCKAAIIRWEYLEGTEWPELFTKSADATDGTLTITSGTYTYTCPTNMRRPPKPHEDYVRIGGDIYIVVPSSKVGQLDDSSYRFCYFTGNPKLGYTLNINPNLTLTTGQTITFEYYRNATYFTAATSTTEISNPMFIVHYALNRLYKNDGLLNEAREELQIAENLLQEMRSEVQVIDVDLLSGDTAGWGV